MLRSDPRYEHLPIVVLTAHEDAENYRLALEAGADDVLQKPLKADRLVSRLRSQLARSKAVRANSARDPLTGLMAYGPALRAAAGLMAATVGRESAFSVGLIDVRGCSAINAEQGREKGDLVLRRLADLLRQCAKSHEVVARWRGDSFFWAFPDTSPEDAETRLAGFCRRFSEEEILERPIELDWALACCPKDGTHMAQLVDRAAGRLNS